MGVTRNMLPSLAEFVEGAERIRQEYAQLGPGGVAPQRYDVVNQSYQRLMEVVATSDARSWASLSLGTFTEALETARERAWQCACTQQGLSFVSGEAGLIPRQDWHRSFDSALEMLRRIHGELSAQAGRSNHGIGDA
jgi:hypothetical protein